LFPQLGSGLSYNPSSTGTGPEPETEGLADSESMGGMRSEQMQGSHDYRH
jgi:hypothetical protein